MGERRALPLRHALALGLLHGPTELLPVSSSGHTTLVPWLAGWPYAELDPKLRKSFEVALHAGTAAALLVRRPWESQTRGIDAMKGAPAVPRLKPAFLLAAVLPPAVAGYVLGEAIERRVGTPGTIAAGLLAGSAAMLAGELSAARAHAQVYAHAGRGDGGAIGAEEARSSAPATVGARDGAALGLAQALALMPGVSRSGATLTAARARGFSRIDSDRLSWSVGLPVIAGAAILKGIRLTREGAPRELRLPLAVGSASAFISTLVSTKLLSSERRASLLPASAAYRIALALLAIRRMRDNTSENDPIPKKIKTSHKTAAVKDILRRSRPKS